MGANNVFEIPLQDLSRDPILPPRIVDDERLEALCRSMAEIGMADPLVVRPVSKPERGGPRYLTVLGYRRQLAAGRLAWEAVPAVVRDDLDDAGVLQLAFDTDKLTETRTTLENCWYYASLCAAGMTQAALAEREEFSEGKASMYVRTGRAITPERIAATGLVPEEVAAMGIVQLAAIASGPEDQVSARILAAVRPSSSEEKRTPAFEWTEGRKGFARATFRTTDVATWSAQERIEFIECVGPLLGAARRLEGVEDPAVVEARSRLEGAQRIALLEAREGRAEQLLRLVELNTKLLVDLNRNRERQPDVSRKVARRGFSAGGFLRLPLNRVFRWLREALTTERKASMLEDSSPKRDPQMRIPFDREQAA